MIAVFSAKDFDTASKTNSENPKAKTEAKTEANVRAGLRPRIVLGIDPGSQHLGFGVVRAMGSVVEFVSAGVISPPRGMKFNDRIGVLSEELEILFENIKPEITVIERVFLGKNADSAFKLGHARGVALATAVRANSQIVEYAARSVKKGITGNGGCTKEQVQIVLLSALGLRGQAQADATDALALAFYHARNLEVIDKMFRGGEAAK